MKSKKGTSCHLFGFCSSTEIPLIALFNFNIDFPTPSKQKISSSTQSDILYLSDAEMNTSMHQCFRFSLFFWQQDVSNFTMSVSVYKAFENNTKWFQRFLGNTESVARLHKGQGGTELLRLTAGPHDQRRLKITFCGKWDKITYAWQ